MKQLAFSVESKFIADFARALMLEDNWRKALLMLTSVSTPPVSMENAIDILKGNLTLEATDENTLRIVPQPQDCPKLQRMQSTENWQQAGLFEKDGFYYQPYGAIDGFGADDEERVLGQLQAWEDSANVQEYREKRAKLYMRDNLNDLVFFDIHAKPIFFKRVPDPAFWRKVWSTPKEALVDFMAHRKGELCDLGSAGTTCSISDWEFYFEGIRRDLVFISQIDWDLPELSDEKKMPLVTLLRLKELFETRLKDADERTAEMLTYHFECDCAAIKLRQKILQQSRKMGGFLSLSLKHPVKLTTGETVTTLTVPAAPFLLWCRGRRDDTKRQGEIPEWKPVCPSGLKMPGDSSTHTDWWVGAGLSPHYAYDTDHPANKSAWAYALARVSEKGSNCIKLAGKGIVTGLIVKPAPNQGVPAGCIAVVPSAGVDYELALMSACKHGTGAVIAEVGGKLAHLAIVSREVGARLVVMDNALQTLNEGDLVTVNLDEGIVKEYKKKDMEDFH